MSEIIMCDADYTPIERDFLGVVKGRALGETGTCPHILL